MTTMQFRAPWSGTLQTMTIVLAGILALAAVFAAILVSTGLARPRTSFMIVLPPLLLAAALGVPGPRLHAH